MPIPKPNSNEEQKDFISRCMGNDTMISEYPDEKQRSAICYNQWRDGGKKGLRDGDREGNHDRPLNVKKLQIDLEDIQGKVIAYPGKFGKGKEITEKDIDEMIANFDAKITEPYLNLDHNDKLTDKVKDALKVVRLGTVSKLYKIGNKLVADFTGIPKKIAELIKNNLINQRSIEMFRTLERAGKVYHNVLHAVSFFGKDLPAIPHLEDYIPALYNESDGKIVKVEFQEASVDKVEISKEEYDQLKKAASDLTAFKAAKDNAEVVKLKDENVTLAEENKTLKKINGELKSFKDQAEADKQTRIESDCDEFLKKNAAKFQPRFREDFKADYLRFAKEDPERLKRFKEEIESRENFGGQMRDPGDPSANTKVNFSDENSVQEAIDKLINSGKAKNWKEARKMLFEQYGREDE